LKGKDLEIVQAKVGRLGMSLMGQALFSRMLFGRLLHQHAWRPKLLRSVALCGRVDPELGGLLGEFGVDVVAPVKGKFQEVN